MTNLRRLYTGSVIEAEIDELGHMNVSFYLDKALQATHALAESLGLGPEAREEKTLLAPYDLFARHFREQLLGAPLEVRGGLQGVHAEGLRFYHELRNTETDELAASFLQKVRIEDLATRKPLPLPEAAVNEAMQAVVEWPEHGRPRTLDLDEELQASSLEELRARDLAMREPRRVLREECDAEGIALASRYQRLAFNGTPTGRVTRGATSLVDGCKMGWATLESRGVIHRLVPVGTLIQSFGAVIELGPKTSLRKQWVFDLDTGHLICTGLILLVSFDLEQRRSIEIPEVPRRELESIYYPDLR